MVPFLHGGRIGIGVLKAVGRLGTGELGVRARRRARCSMTDGEVVEDEEKGHAV